MACQPDRNGANRQLISGAEGERGCVPPVLGNRPANPGACRLVSVFSMSDGPSQQPELNSHVESLEKQLHLAQTRAFTRQGRQVGHLHHTSPGRDPVALGTKHLGLVVGRYDVAVGANILEGYTVRGEAVGRRDGWSTGIALLPGLRYRLGLGPDVQVGLVAHASGKTISADELAAQVIATPELLHGLLGPLGAVVRDKAEAAVATFPSPRHEDGLGTLAKSLVIKVLSDGFRGGGVAQVADVNSTLPDAMSLPAVRRCRAVSFFASVLLPMNPGSFLGDRIEGLKVVQVGRKWHRRRVGILGVWERG